MGKESSVEKQESAELTETTKFESETEVPTTPIREATPDIIRKSPVKEVVAIENIENITAETPKKIITSEEEAKARLAEKRREMKEKMEREAELERQKQVNLFSKKKKRNRI